MTKLLVPYLTAGFPKREWFAPIVKALDAGGADVIEVGVPFSDPIADGPTIQNSSQIALANGTTVAWILDEIRAIRAHIKAELIFFSYFNPFASIGKDLNACAAAIKEAGFSGVLIPDLSLEGASHVIKALRDNDLHYIPLIAPTTTDARLAKIAPHTTSFAYGVAVTGVTGARVGVSAGLDDYLARVRKHFKQFVVGFGISTPEDAANIAKQADGVVVGSGLVRKIGEAKTQDEATQVAESFMRSLRDAIDA